MANDSKSSQGSQGQPHTPGQTEGSRKGLDDQHASQHKNRDRTEPQTVVEPGDAAPIATFDEGERRPSPIESPGQGGLRAPAPIVSADPKDYKAADTDRDENIDATMAPGGGREPKRNTM